MMGTAGLVGTLPTKSSGVMSAVSGPYGSTTGIVSKGDADADDDDAPPKPPLGTVAIAAANTEAASPPPPATRAMPAGGFRPGPLRLSSTARVSNCTARDGGIIPQGPRAELVRIPDRYWFDTAATAPDPPAAPPPPLAPSLASVEEVPRGSRNRSLRAAAPDPSRWLPSALGADPTRLGSQRPSAQAYCPTCRSQNEMDRMVPSRTVFPAVPCSSLFFFFSSSPLVSPAAKAAAASSSSATSSLRHSSALIQAATSATFHTLTTESRA